MSMEPVPVATDATEATTEASDWASLKSEEAAASD